ncbi:MAG: antibiotic biosynthesis monooxygenase [Stappiaceae bacterium]
MSDEIQWHLRVKIKPGQLEAFKSVMTEMVAVTRQEEGMLIYEWYFSEDETICEIHERYRDTAAVLVHANSFGIFAARFQAAAIPVSMNVYGSPTEGVRTGLAPFKPDYYEMKDGFARL